nr:hypothetical protein [Victivallales bacterium]
SIIKFCSVPFLSLLLFYLPNWGRFLRVLSIREGWQSSAATTTVFYGTTLIIFLIPVAISLISLFSRQSISKLRASLCVSVFVIPLVFFVFRAPSPFPRTFLCILPVWLFLFSVGIGKFEEQMRKKFSEVFAEKLVFALVILSIISGNIVMIWSDSFSKICSKYGQDDFFSPYFMKKEFNPDNTVSGLIALTEEKDGLVFSDINSDPPSLRFSAMRFGMTDGFIIFDRPKKSVEIFPPEGERTAFIVANGKERATEICKRFNLVLTAEEGGNLNQKIFRVEKYSPIIKSPRN